MPERLHKDIRTQFGDASSGPHVVHYYTFADGTALSALNDTQLGTVTLAATDVGRVARVGSAAPYTFYVLVDHSTPTWRRIDLEGLTDASFAGSDAGRLVRTGVGTYAVVKDNLAAAGVPTASDDETQGYQRGSLWFTGVNMWVCVDATAGSAEWYRVAKPATGTPEPIAATGSVGTSAQHANADHVHAHGDQAGGTLHAAATSSSPGFMSATDVDFIYEQQDRVELWRDDFVLNITNRWTTDVTGAGATAALAAAAHAYPAGRLQLSTGTTNTGASGVRAPINGFYPAGIDRISQVVACGMPALSDGTDTFRVLLCGLYIHTTFANGIALVYDSTVSANWQLCRFAGGVVAAAQNTGIAAASGAAPGYGERRFEVAWDKAAQEAYAYVDGVLVATLAVTTAEMGAANYHYPARIEKSVGTTSRSVVIDFAYAIATPTAGFRV